jgi:hypothetical protein
MIFLLKGFSGVLQWGASVRGVLQRACLFVLHFLIFFFGKFVVALQPVETC